MGWVYRKSLGFGPFRVNLSKSGIGYSLGGGGFRMGRMGSGRRYSSFNLPGTGMTYRKYGRGSGCLLALCVLVVAVAAIAILI